MACCLIALPAAIRVFNKTLNALVPPKVESGCKAPKALTRIDAEVLMLHA
jgi:hypothetical protein